MNNKKAALVIAVVIVVFSIVGILLGIGRMHIKENENVDNSRSNDLVSGKVSTEYTTEGTSVSSSEAETKESQKEIEDKQKDQEIKGKEIKEQEKKEQEIKEKEIEELRQKQEQEQKVELEQRRLAFNISTESALYTFEQMEADLGQMSELYPEYLTIESVGVTADNRNLWMATLGNRTAEKHVLVQASIHAREYMNTLITMKNIEYYLENYDTGTYNEYSFSQLFDRVCFHIMPMSNPDGVAISQSGPEAIRDSNLRNIIYQCYNSDLAIGKVSTDEAEYWRLWKANARGVDLNRNFNSGWDMYEGTTGPSADHYKGEAPESELETQAILKVMKEYPTAVVISNHSMGNIIYWDCGSQGEVHEADRQLAELVSRVTGFGTVSSSQSNQDAAGCGDYAILELGILEVTIESGSGSCPLGIEEFDGLWNANRDVWPAVADFCI